MTTKAKPTLGSDPSLATERLLAALLCVSLGTRYSLPYGLQAGVLLASVLIPIWLLEVRRYRLAVLLLGLMALTVLVGLVLTAVDSGHVVLRSAAVSRSFELVGLGVSVGVLLWARTLWGRLETAAWYGLGMLAGIPLNATATDNPWRFTFSLPVTVFVLAMTSRKSFSASLAACGVLTAVGFLNDSRSNSTMILLAALFATWSVVSHHATPASKSTKRGANLVVAAGVAYLVYYLVTNAILGGYFGEVTQERTQRQLEQSGSLLLGGRPELAAAWALAREHPWGIGPGAKATYGDLSIARHALAATGYDPDNGYVSSYLFGGAIEVHSGWGDLWLRFGPMGLVLAIVIAWIVIRALVRPPGGQLTLDVLTAYLAVRCLWDLGFSPLGSSLWLLPITLAVCLSDRDQSAKAPATTTGTTLGPHRESAAPALTRS